MAGKRHIKLEGRTFGKLRVLSYQGGSRYLCDCDCGGTAVVRLDHLRKGDTKSCGCIVSERMSNLKRSHGMTKTPEYQAWSQMKCRCYNESKKNFPDYGGRGIRVCDRWLESFENFLADMGRRPEYGTLERKDVNGNYEPSNCCWATRAEQNRNRTDNVKLTHEGRTMTVAEWSRVVGINMHTIYVRLKRGWSPERALTTIARPYSFIKRRR